MGTLPLLLEAHAPNKDTLPCMGAQKGVCVGFVFKSARKF